MEKVIIVVERQIIEQGNTELLMCIAKDQLNKEEYLLDLRSEYLREKEYAS